MSPYWNHSLMNEEPTLFIQSPGHSPQAKLLFPARSIQSVSNRQQLISLTRSGIAHADLTTPYQFFVSRKGFLSFTSNGLNHPNDFGHRIYADTLNHTISPSSSTKPSTPQSINASANMI